MNRRKFLSGLAVSPVAIVGGVAMAVTAEPQRVMFAVEGSQWMPDEMAIIRRRDRARRIINARCLEFNHLPGPA